MSPDSIGPLTRPLPLHRVTAAGLDVHVETTADERAALARDLGLPALHALDGRFRVVSAQDRIRVTGRVTARLDRTCVVSLEGFPSSFVEDVDVAFAAPDPRRQPAGEVEISLDLDPPEDLVGDTIDLGAMTAEFLALGLDPYPRKPGAAFETDEDVPSSSPFDALAALRPDLPEKSGRE